MIYNDSKIYGLSKYFKMSEQIQIEKRVLYLTIGFFCAYFAIQANQGVQTIINDEGGYLNVGMCYFTYAFGALIVPAILHKLPDDFGNGSLPLIFAAGLSALAIFSNMFVLPDWVFLIVFAFNGFGLALLMVTNLVIVSKCGLLSSQLSQREDSVDPKTVEHEVSRFTAQLYSMGIYFPGVVGSAVSSIVILACNQDLSVARAPMFVILGVIGALAMFVFFLMPSLPIRLTRQDIVDYDVPGPWSVVRNIFVRPKLYLVLPAAFAHGVFMAFAFGDIPARAVKPLLGPGYCGFVLTLYFAVNTVAAVAWGRVLDNVGRLKCFSIATIMLIVGIVILMGIVVGFEGFFERNGSSGYMVLMTIAKVAGLIISCCLMSVGQTMYEVMVPAVLQAYFPRRKDSASALGAYRFIHSIGTALMFVLNIIFTAHEKMEKIEDYWKLSIRGLFAIILTIVGWLLLTIADRKFPMDGNKGDVQVELEDTADIPSDPEKVQERDINITFVTNFSCWRA